MVTGWFEEATNLNYKAHNSANAYNVGQATHALTKAAQKVRYRQKRQDLVALLEAVREAQRAARRNRKVAMDIEADIASFEAAVHVALENGDYVEDDPSDWAPAEEWLARNESLYGIERGQG